jgi:hypothetical protein
MLEVLPVRNLSPLTQRSYVEHVARFVRHFGRSPEGLGPEGTRWIAYGRGFFLPVRVLSRLFRRRFLTALQEAFDAGRLHFAGSLHPLADPSGFAAHLYPTRHTDWVVYAKRPFAGPQ